MIVEGNDPGKCSKSNHGKQILVKDRKNNDLVIFCTKNDGEFKWTTTAGWRLNT